MKRITKDFTSTEDKIKKVVKDKTGERIAGLIPVGLGYYEQTDFPEIIGKRRYTIKHEVVMVQTVCAGSVPHWEPVDKEARRPTNAVLY